ncbi:protein translocase subunit SecD [Brevifollis gellanilyticus]|uniref:Multifunctional fusion protein n=1 Tax=Brevifollis gellanilyticus TaxID=748831 RepID=A0A512MGG4_9BACT|nr:protein translocase subunit SecD [Brevifollis gellanilyticus]GEP45819.1 protein translocase subunit SecDF [Brevifollis gellanilyticus]
MHPIFTFLVGSAILLLLLFYIGSVVHSTKRKVGTALIALMTFFAIITVKNAGIPLGIDLKGGSEFVVRLKPSADKDGKTHTVTADEVQQAIAILEKRLNPENNKDLSMQPQGSDRILIQMPGVKPEEFAAVRTAIQQVAKLEFRIVHQDSRSKIAEIDGGGLTEPGWEKMKYKEQKDDQGKVLPDRGSELVRGRPDMEGDGVSNAFATMDAEGWKVYLDLNNDGSKKFDEIAAVNKGRQLGIIVDNEIISAPTLQVDHFGGTAVISGNFNRESATQLATLLKNPLKNPMQIESENAVSSSYGQSSIDQGKWICVAGLAMTTLFMLFIYRMAGLVAIVGLVINLVVLFGGMALFQFTLTMPGIAGVVLTIGMAVDANVLIYERLREEMEAGKTLTAALEAAYEKAFSAIADSNITTIIAAVILLSISGGLVAGFAVTLLIGLVSSLLGALVVTRVIFMWVIDTGTLKTLKTTKIIPDRVFDILAKAPKFIIASLVVTAISFATLAVKGGNSFGIDFRGGSLLHIELADGKKIADKDLEDLFKPLKMKAGDGKEASVGTFYIQHKSTTTGGEIIAVRGEQNAGAAFEGAVNAKFKDSIKGTSLETVGSLIGQESGVTSIIAMGVALLAIFVYLLFRYEFAFALGAVIALFHDVLMVPGLCVLFGQELSLIHVGALLTIAGYSINDTIVVFDRIRETIQRGGSGSIRDLMNEAICKTLSRTLLTGPTALAPMVILLFLGNPAMLEFAMPITIGVLLGTYSSIFIASPLVLWYATKTGVSLKHKVLESHEAARMADAAVAASKASGA